MISDRGMSSSNLNSRKSSLKNNKVKISSDFKNYLQTNKTLKEAIDISFKYTREKLKILVANDETYSLFFVQTCIEKFENVSLINIAQNG